MAAGWHSPGLAATGMLRATDLMCSEPEDEQAEQYENWPGTGDAMLQLFHAPRPGRSALPAGPTPRPAKMLAVLVVSSGFFSTPSVLGQAPVKDKVAARPEVQPVAFRIGVA